MEFDRLHRLLHFGVKQIRLLRLIGVSDKRPVRGVSLCQGDIHIGVLDNRLNRIKYLPRRALNPVNRILDGRAFSNPRRLILHEPKERHIVFVRFLHRAIGFVRQDAGVPKILRHPVLIRRHPLGRFVKPTLAFFDRCRCRRLVDSGFNPAIMQLNRPLRHHVISKPGHVLLFVERGFQRFTIRRQRAKICRALLKEMRRPTNRPAQEAHQRIRVDTLPAFPFVLFDQLFHLLDLFPDRVEVIDEFRIHVLKRHPVRFRRVRNIRRDLSQRHVFVFARNVDVIRRHILLNSRIFFRVFRELFRRHPGF